MKSTLTRDFRALFERLPPGVQARALKQFGLWTRDHGHPSPHFKRLGRFWSARVDLDYRVLGLEREGTIHWFYIGSHDGYEERV